MDVPIFSSASTKAARGVPVGSFKSTASHVTAGVAPGVTALMLTPTASGEGSDAVRKAWARRMADCSSAGGSTGAGEVVDAG